MRAEAGKPFARTMDDPELDASLRERARFGDPMAHLARRKAAAGAPPPPPVVPAHLARQFRKSGFIVPQVRPANGMPASARPLHVRVSATWVTGHQLRGKRWWPRRRCRRTAG